MNDILYPQPPATIYAEKLQPSAAFRSQAVKVIASIVLFLLTYLVLLAAAVVLAILCCLGGYYIIVNVPRLITIVIGLGLIVLGLSVIFFLVKFIFAVTKDENKSRVEVTEDEQPRLFAFIRQLTEDTNTPFPRKIFLSPEVNACVFYHSSFWSMFLPIPKNLEIGLGLVNSINISEFKAVMAHEFGHFSQRSMKLGSFTYNANRIIHNMLYENNDYVSFIQGWGNIHGALAILALMTFKIAQGIQWILRGVYKLINLSYMGLSREMEFHADTIAASVAGGNNLVSALSRVEVASGCFQTSIGTAEEQLRQKKVSLNIFQNQLTVFRTLAKRHGLELKDGLPDISYQFVSSFSSSRVNFKNQWASHPSLDDRRAHLINIGMNAPAIETSAWTIFDNTTALQEKLTKQLYQGVRLERDVAYYGSEEFDSWYHAKTETFHLPIVYKGYYDDRYPDIQDWNMEEVKNTPVSVQSMEELFSEENGGLFNSISKNKHDINIVKAIQSKQVDVSSFDFDGVKYKRKDGDQVIAILEADIAAAEEKITLLDKQAYAFFYSETVKEKYLSFKSWHERTEKLLSVLTVIAETIQPFYTDRVMISDILPLIEKLKKHDEPAFQELLRAYIHAGLLSATVQSLVERYLTKDYQYFVDNAFVDEELNDLREVRLEVLKEINEARYKAYKEMLVEQLATTSR